MKRVRWMATLLLLALALPLLFGALPARAQEATPITLDEAHFGVAQMEALDPQAEAIFTLALKAGDRVALDLQGENDGLQVTQFAAPYGSLELQATAPSAYMAWAPEDGDYTITVKNTSDRAAGFTLRAVASPAPLPAKKIITEDAAGQAIPVTLGEPFQVELDAAASESYAWTLQPVDAAVLQQEGDAATILLGTMPGAMSRQIFTFNGIAPGAAMLAFNYAKEGSAAEKSFSVSIDVAAAEGAEEAAPTEEATESAEPAAGEEPTPQPLTLDEGDKAQVTGSLEPQGMAAYVVTIAAGAQVQAAVTPADSSLVLTVVGADGVPLQTDHAGASDFDQTVPADQEYTFKVINFGEGAQEYTFDIAVTAATTAQAAPAEAPAEAAEAEAAAPILPEPITLDQGDVLVIPLAGNPSTGYLWQVKPSAEGILTPRGEADFAAPSDAPGAPGYEILTFDAAGAGDVTLSFTYSQPWDETTPPEQSFDLPFTVKAPAAPVEPPAPPAPITIGADENGGAVDMQIDGMLFVELPGNPTTGYIWQITSKDDAFLQPVDYAFQPDSGAIGAGSVERFEFEAVAAGEVVLEFAQSRPWETDAEPVATYAVTVRIGESPAN